MELLVLNKLIIKKIKIYIFRFEINIIKKLSINILISFQNKIPTTYPATPIELE